MDSRFAYVANLGVAFRRQGGGAPFGITLPDRLLHMYIIGQTGSGKSTLLGNLATQDAEHGLGFCMIDPHGDLASRLSESIKAEHIYWRVGDSSCPYGYNPLTSVSPAFRPLVASGLIDTLKKQWSDAWGARMEHLLRYAILALLEQPKSDLRDIMPLFTQKDFRRAVIGRVKDPQVYRFWTEEYPNMNYKNSQDGAAPIANKLGAFLSHPLVREAVCEPKEPLRFRKLMDAGTPIIVNLAKGQVGVDVANVIGGLLISSLMNAAFSRHDIPEEERRPFIVYADEFHSFTTSAFASMLSESRKYGLGLTLAHQHLVQTDKSVLEAILGNVGTQIVFRIGAQDAPTFTRQLDIFSIPDLVYQPNYRAVVQMMVNGEKLKPFSADMHPWIQR